MVDYSWVPWFTELARKIAEGGKAELVKKAKQVTWFHSSDDPPILRGGDNVDPFSFIYSLTPISNSFTQRLESAGTVYAVQAALPPRDPCIPRANPTNTLFNDMGKQEPDILWDLFIEAVEDEPEIDDRLFSPVLRINNVGVVKLTQTLFIINATHFLPADTSNKVLPRSEFQKQPENYEEYAARVDAIKALFPNCKPYEINTFLDMQGRQAAAQEPLITNKTSYFQVSTSIDGDGSEDYWAEFVKENAVRTGYKGPPDRAYPVSEPNRGDVVLVRYGVTNGRGIGVVETNGYSAGWRENQRISVCWINKQEARLNGRTDRRGFGYAGKESESYEAFRQTDGYSETLNLIDRLAHDGKADPGRPAKPQDDVEIRLSSVHQILYGPPGTGKTYLTAPRCVEICDRTGRLTDDQICERYAEIRKRYQELVGCGRVEFVTFHQSYGYEEFVEGLRPAPNEGGQIGFRLVPTPGVLKRIAERARNDFENAYVLVIDEINRANVSKVLGELITLLEEDKREGAPNEVAVTLPHSRKRFTLPPNLHILGTMNTADRSIALIDTALRRRFQFEEMAPKPELLSVVDGIDLPAVLKTINERLEYLIDRDHLIGHAWLMNASTKADVGDIFRRKIIPLVAEYFYDDWRKVLAVLGDTDDFVRRERLSPPGLDEEDVDERFRWTVRDDFAPDAYRRLISGQSASPEADADA